MSCYDKNKLLALLAQRHSAHLALSDLSVRRREAKDAYERLRNHIHSEGQHTGGDRRFIERMLALSLAEAEIMTRTEIEGYERQTQDGLEFERTGMNYVTWRKYLDARRRLDRLQQQYDAVSADFHARFAILPRLLDAVHEWGFCNPEMEI